MFFRHYNSVLFLFTGELCIISQQDHYTLIVPVQPAYLLCQLLPPLHIPHHHHLLQGVAPHLVSAPHNHHNNDPAQWHLVQAACTNAGVPLETLTTLVLHHPLVLWLVPTAWPLHPGQLQLPVRVYFCC